MFGGNQGLGNYTLGVSAPTCTRSTASTSSTSTSSAATSDNGTAVTSQNGFTTFLKDRGFVSLTFKTTF